jgi:hypothetical protein
MVLAFRAETRHENDREVDPDGRQHTVIDVPRLDLAIEPRVHDLRHRRRNWPPRSARSVAPTSTTSS